MSLLILSYFNASISSESGTKDLGHCDELEGKVLQKNDFDRHERQNRRKNQFETIYTNVRKNGII